jgi:hypothetical protein
MTDDFDRAETPVMGTPCRNDCPLAKSAVRAHWLNLLAPGGSIAKLAEIVDTLTGRLDAAVKRLDKLSARSRTLTLALGILVLTLASFAAGAVSMRAIAWVARARP